jgi:hypothetical protein
MSARLAAAAVLTIALLAARPGATAPAKDAAKASARPPTIEPEEPTRGRAATDVEEPARDTAPAPTPALALAPPPAVEAAPVVTPAVTAPKPAIGFGDSLYIRAPGDEVVVFPSARLQVDGAFFPRQSPKSGAYLRRARVGLRGWLGRAFYFDVSADFAPPPPDADASAGTYAPSVFPTADNYIAFAPAGDRFIVQAGLFDAPFTLENRTSDAYTDFIERSMVVRLLGVPRNKEVGVMAHGLVGDVFYYSAGAFNGEGPEFRNADNQPDAIGRLVVTPFGARPSAFRRLAVGGSGWYGRHAYGPLFPAQATPGGVRFVVPRWVTGQGTQARTLEMREHGTVVAAAGEVTLPIGTRFGLRAEVVWKQQQLSEVDATAPTVPLSAAQLDGLGGYGEVWLWLAGNERHLPAPGLQLPLRADRPGGGGGMPTDGLMLALRGEMLKEDMTSDAAVLGNPTRATTRVISGTLGVNYWRGSLVRVSVNYILNSWGGTSETAKTLRAQGALQHELLLRFAMAL